MNKDKEAFIKGDMAYIQINDNKFMRTADSMINEHIIAGVYENEDADSIAGISFENSYLFDGLIIDGKLYSAHEYDHFWESNEQDEYNSLRLYTEKLKENLTAKIITSAFKQYGKIKPNALSPELKKRAESKIKNGDTPLDEKEMQYSIKNHLIETLNAYYEGMTTNYLISKQCADDIKQSAFRDFYIYTAKQKAMNRLMEDLVKNGLSGDVQIKQILKKLKNSSAKYVTVDLDFGYTHIRVKLSTDIDTYSFLRSQSETKDFISRYRQPYSSSTANYEDFIPYITKIVYGKRILYNRAIILDDIPKRSLYNAVGRIAENESDQNLNDKLLCQIRTLLKSENIKFTDADEARDDLLSRLAYSMNYLNIRQATAKLLIKHGYDTTRFMRSTSLGRIKTLIPNVEL